MNAKILRLQQVTEITGLPKSSVWALAKQGRFPAPIKLAGRRTGWSAKAVSDWCSARLHGAAA